jgi:integrase/recombinase XerD
MKIFMDVNQIKRFLSAAAEERTTGNIRDLALFHLSLSTGLRISDLLRLKRDNLIDADGAIVRCLRIKMKKTRNWIERPLREDCRAVLHEYLSSRTDANPYLFPAFHRNQYVCAGQPMSRMSAHRIYKKYLRKLFPASMIVGAATHTSRRSMGKIISQKAGRIEPASKFLGHRNVASTAAYIDMESHEQKANDIVTEIEL